MNKLEQIKKKLIKKAKLDTVDKTIDLVNKYLSKMTLKQLIIARDYAKNKQMKNGVNEGNTTFLKLVDEKIEETKHGKK